MKNKKTSSWLPRSIIIFMLAVLSLSTVLADDFAPPTQWNPANVDYFNLPDGSIGAIISMLASWLVGMIGFFGIIGFMTSGIMYLVSTGNDDMISKAKKYMTYSLVGVIVGLSGFVVLQAVDLMLNASVAF